MKLLEELVHENNVLPAVLENGKRSHQDYDVAIVYRDVT